MVAAVETGIPALDQALRGGYHPGEVSLIYGEEKSGKTSLALQASLFVLSRGMKVIWIDCGGRLHPERLSQVFSHSQADQNNMVFSIPRSFEEQTRMIEVLPLRLPEQTGLLVFENFNMLHRVHGLFELQSNRRMLKDLNFQLACLKELVAQGGVPLIVTAQVHEALNKPSKSNETTVPAASRISMYWADTILRTKNQLLPALKVVSVEKGRMGRVPDIVFRVTDSGVSGTGS